ncbi:MAG: class I SAM-dependent methyltransferase [Bacteriovorax sp.]|nr:class I SAM-dependent methyltransferase [Bacteriovorax sp.]
MKIICDQEKLWTKEWKKGKVLLVNNFAKRSLLEIKKQRNLKTILDLGCGSGQDAVFFAEHGFRVTAVDFSEAGLSSISGDIPNLKKICSGINELKLKPNSFDVIYAHLSLHYFDDKTTTKIFTNLFKALNNGGLIFVKCKSIDDSLYGLGEEVGRDIYYYKKQYRHFFSKDYMLEKLSSFKIIKIRKSTSVYHNFKSSFIEAVARK